ncbi:MAG: hypothetical protein ABFS23_04775 [Pseudomonadota bacterium]
MVSGTPPLHFLLLAFLSLFALAPPPVAAGSADEFFDDTFGDFREELEAAREQGSAIIATFTLTAAVRCMSLR